MNTTAPMLLALDAMAHHLATARENGHEMDTASSTRYGIISLCGVCGAHVEVLRGCHQWLADHWGITDRCGEGEGNGEAAR